MVCSARQGKESHKTMDPDTHFLMKLYYTDRTVLFMVCAGNELCFIFMYALGWYSSWSIYLGLLLTAPVCIFKQMMNVIQLVAASKTLADGDLAESNKKH